MREATAAALPPEDPPGMRSVSQGLRVVLKSGVFRGRAHRELIQVRPPEENRARRAQFPDNSRIVGGDEAF